MTEHEDLREAIRVARHVMSGNSGVRPDMVHPKWLTLLADAAESTLPKTKMVEVWRIEWALSIDGSEWEPMGYQKSTQAEAQQFADNVVKGAPGKKVACIRVTGPHMQEVPA